MIIVTWILRRYIERVGEGLLCARISSVVATLVSEHISLFEEGPLLEMLEFLAISHDSYQPLNFLL